MTGSINGEQERPPPTGPEALVINYYHPWTYGGSERFNQLAREELRQGRAQAFVYVADGGPEQLVREHARDPGFAQLALYKLVSPSTVKPQSAYAEQLTGPDHVPLLSLVDVFRPDYVRAHFPTREFVDLLEHDVLRSMPFVYDVMDLWGDFAVQPWGDSETERYYVQRADAIVAASALLLEKFSWATRRARIPMGIDARFLDAIREPFAVGLDGKKRTQALYTGSLGGIWFDWDLVLDLVHATPDLDFTFIGWIGPPPEEHHPEQSARAATLARQIDQLPNVRVLPPVAHADLAPYLRKADVGLIPFREMDLVTAVNPLKVFEYIGTGIPTVQIGIPSIADYPGVRTARDHANFIELVATNSRRTVGAEESAAMRAFANDHTWIHRVRDFDELVSDLGADHQSL